MAIIGQFRAAKDGGWQGRICTLTINVRPRLVPNDDKSSPTSPDFLITSQGCQIGAAWNRRAGSDGRPYLSVRLEDPFQPEPISAALFPNDDGITAALVWDRKMKSGGTGP